MAIRLSIGAGRGQLVRQLLGESLLLAIFGGIGGVIVAQWTLNLMAALLPAQAAETVSLTIDPIVMLFAAALAIDPKDARARFYLAVGESQAGHLEAALVAWVALESDSPADAPWRPMVAAQIEETAKKLGRDPASLPGRKPPSPVPPPPSGTPATANGVAPGPSAEDMAKAASMTPEQRAAWQKAMAPTYKWAKGRVGQEVLDLLYKELNIQTN